MARELDGFRENLELLNQRFPDRDMLSAQDVMATLGVKTQDTVRKHLGDKIVNNRISKIFLARYMCGGK